MTTQYVLAVPAEKKVVPISAFENVVPSHAEYDVWTDMGNIACVIRRKHIGPGRSNVDAVAMQVRPTPFVYFHLIGRSLVSVVKRHLI